MGATARNLCPRGPRWALSAEAAGNGNGNYSRIFFLGVWQNGNLMRSIRLSRCKYSWVLLSAAAAHHALMLDQHGGSKRSFTTTLPSPSLFSPMPPQFQRFRIGPEGSPSPSRRGEVRELVRRKVFVVAGRRVRLRTPSDCAQSSITHPRHSRTSSRVYLVSFISSIILFRPGDKGWKAILHCYET